MSSVASGEPRTVYREMRVEAEVCDLGETHDVRIYGVKTLTPTGETRPYDNGYETREMPLFTDVQGRVYHARLEIDFHASTYYVRLDDRQSFDSRVRRPARDLLGRLL